MTNVTTLGAPAQTFAAAAALAEAIRRRRRRTAFALRLLFTALVAAPTLATGAYYAFWAADQYAARALFSIRETGEPPISLDLFGFGGSLASSASVNFDAYIVMDYIRSAEIIDDILQEEGLDVRQVFAHPAADWWARADASTPVERFVSDWNERIRLGFNARTGIVSFDVRAFTGEDAARVGQAVIAASERLVNRLSAAAQSQVIEVAQGEVRRTEARVREARQRTQAFRDREQMIDPSLAATGQIAIIGQLEAQRSSLLARRDTRSRTAGADSPSLRVIDSQISGLDQQIAEQRARLGTGQSGADEGESAASPTLSRLVGEYVELMVDQEFAETSHLSALAALERAIVDSQKQQRYFALFVSPRQPQVPEYPQRLKNTGLVFLGSLAIWAVIVLTGAAIVERRD